MIQSDTEVSCERFPRRGGERDTPTLATRYALLSAGCWIWQQILLDIDMWEDGTDHVLYPWCFHVWWDVADPPCPTAWHSEGYVHKGWTLFFFGLDGASTHSFDCSWEELHLSQVLVTTQMICRYYWNQLHVFVGSQLIGGGSCEGNACGRCGGCRHSGWSTTVHHGNFFGGKIM